MSKHKKRTCISKNIDKTKDVNIDINKYSSKAIALYVACINQDEDMIKQLIKNGINLDTQVMAGKTALHIACIKNNLQIIRVLIEGNVNINIQDNIGNTPLHQACIQKNGNIVKLLLDKDANVNIANNARELPLHLACYKGNTTIVKWLLQKGANANEKAKYGITPLHYACYIGNMEMIKILLNNCANPNIKNERGQLPINIACQNNKPQIVDELVKGNSIVPLSVIDWAIQKEEMSILKSLAQRNDVAKYLIKKLIVSDKIELLREIREARININSMDEVDEISLLEFAIKSNNIDMANILMAYNFGNISNTVTKLNELVNNVCVNNMLEYSKNQQATIIKRIKRERESENIIDLLCNTTKKCKILAK